MANEGGTVGESGFEGDINVALDIGDDKGVFGRGVVAVGPFVGGTFSAGGVEDGSGAGFEIPFAVDGTDDRRLLDSENEGHDAVAAESVEGEGLGRIGGRSLIVGLFVVVPIETVASVGVDGVVARLVDGDIQVDGAVVASVPAVVDDSGVEDGVIGESLGCGAGERTDGEENAVAANHSGVGGGEAGRFDFEVDGVISDAVCGGVGVEETVDAGSGVGFAMPGLGGASGVDFHAGGVNHDGEVQGVECVAASDAVVSGEVVCTRCSVGGVVPGVVTAVFDILDSVHGRNDAEVEHVDVGAAVDGAFDGDEGGVGVDAGDGVGAVVPSIFTAGADTEGVGLLIADKEVERVDAIAVARGDVGENGVVVVAGVDVGVATPGVAATVNVGIVGVAEGGIDGQVEDKECVA